VTIYLIQWISCLALRGYDLILIVASMGAAGVLLFAISPRHHVLLLAVSGAILAMHLTRSLHLSCGAMVLLAMLINNAVPRASYPFKVDDIDQ